MIEFLKYLKNEKLNEIMGVIVFALGILILVSILTFSPNDPPLSTKSGQYYNYCGPIGAYLAAGLFIFIGKSVYILPLLIFIFGFYEFKEKQIKEKAVTKVIGIICIMISVSILLTLIGGNIENYIINDAPTEDLAQNGGILGLWFVVNLYPLIKYGIYIVFFLFFMLGLILSTSVSFSEFLKKTYSYILKITNYLFNFIKSFIFKIGFECKEIFLYFKDKTFKEAIQIYSVDDDGNPIPNASNSNTKPNNDNNQKSKTVFKAKQKPTEPVINKPEQISSTLDEPDNSYDDDADDDYDANQGDSNDDKKRSGFSIFKRKKKIEEVNTPDTDPKINKTYFTSENDDDFEHDKNNTSTFEPKINQPHTTDISEENVPSDNSNDFVSTQSSSDKIKSDSRTDKVDSKNLSEEELAKKIKAEQEKLDREFAAKAINPDSNDVESEAADEAEEEVIVEKPPYELPPMSLLNFGKNDAPGPTEEALKKVSDVINKTLESFKVEATVTEINPGPTVTMFEVVPSSGVPVRKIVKHADDLKLRLAVKSIRIIAPIPGKSAVGIEVPNDIANLVTLKDVLVKNKVNPNDISSKLSFGLGKDVLGKPLSVNLTKMPHLLIAGATGAGKSVCINTIIVSMLMYASPDELKFIMIDPKVVELSSYNKLPHLITPVVVDPKKAAKALQWAVDEMEERYVRCGEIGARNIERYNQIIKQQIDSGEYDSLPRDERPEVMPYVVIIVDELADLMMTARECESAIARIAQKARAVGIHLILATQRPSVNVITGLIKANFPTRIAFQVSSHVDSKTILDSVGAENLLGNGDMLYLSRSAPKPIRLQGTFLSDPEINKVIEFISNQDVAHYYVQKKPEEIFQFDEENENSTDADMNDPLIKEAEELVVGEQRGSIAMLQKKLKIGHTRAQSLMEALEVKGIVGPGEGPKPREVLVSKEAYFGFSE